MSIFNIPVQSVTDANSIAVELSGFIFELKFRFNANEGMWYMTLKKNDVEIVSNVKLVSTDDLLSQYTAYDVPQGVLSIVDQDGLYADPNNLNFGESVFLRYDDLQ